MLEKLLNDIVAVDVCHERDGVRADLVEDGLAVLVSRLLDALLNKARAGLVTGELDNVPGNVLKVSYTTNGV